MNADSSASASNVGTTPASAAPNTADRAEPTEAEFLEQEAGEAHRAISRTLQLIGKNLGHGLDPRAWAREHPWISLGTALAGGFLAAEVMLPNEKRRELRRIVALKKALAKELQATQEGTSKSEKDGREGKKVLGQILKIARPLVIGGFNAWLASQNRQSSPDIPENTPRPTPGGDDSEVIEEASNPE